MKGIEYRGLSRIEGPVVIAARSRNVGFNEVVAVYDREGGRKLGRVVDMSEDWTAVQIFGSTTGLSAEDSRMEFLGEPLELRVGPGLLGRVFNGLGEPVDGYGEIFSSRRLDVNGLPINPYARVYPRDFIQTGVSAIDGMNTLIRCQTCISLGAPLIKITSLPFRERLSRLKSAIKNDDLPAFTEFEQEMKNELETLERSYRTREVL